MWTRRTIMDVGMAFRKLAGMAGTMTAVAVPQLSTTRCSGLRCRQWRNLAGRPRLARWSETVIKQQGFSDVQQDVLHNDGPETEIGYRLAWARTYLKGMGLLTNSARGVWV